MKVPKYIERFVENYCKLNNLTLTKLYLTSYDIRVNDNWKGNIPQYTFSCMNDENKFLKFKIDETIFNENGEVMSHLKVERC